MKVHPIQWKNIYGKSATAPKSAKQVLVRLYCERKKKNILQRIVTCLRKKITDFFPPF
jgi:hypothetical protein